MATPIYLKSSSVTSKVPTTSTLSLRELGVNTTDGILYLRKGTGIAGDSIIPVNPWKVSTGGTTAYNTYFNVGNVGIGTTTPGYALDVNGNINTSYIYSNGGTFTQQLYLNLNGNANAVPIAIVGGNGSTGGAVVQWANPTITTAYVGHRQAVLGGTGYDYTILTTGGLGFGVAVNNQSSYSLFLDPSSNLLIGTAVSTGTASQKLQVNSGAYISGNVGIGITNPTQTLHVVGNSRVTGAIYDSNNSAGSTGLYLQSTGTGTSWSTVTPTLSTLTFGNYLTGGSYNGTTPVTVGVAATSLNTINTIVSRDANNNFATNAITLGIGSASSPTLNFSTGTSTGIFSPSANIFSISTNGSERFRVDNLGNVAINTSTISTIFQVYAASGTTGIGASVACIGPFPTGNNNTSSVYGAVNIGDWNALGQRTIFSLSSRQQSGSNYTNYTGEIVSLRFNGTGTDASTGIVAAEITARTTNSGYGNTGTDQADLVFKLSGVGGGRSTPVERFRITGAGNVGIGTSTPSQSLHVIGNSYVTGARYDSNNSSGTTNQILTSTGTGTSWSSFANLSNRSVTYQTATQGQTTFTVSYNVGNLDVFLNGAKLQNTSDYTATNGTSVVLATGAISGDILEFIAYNISIVSTNYGTLSNSITTASTSQATILSASSTAYRSVEFTIQATQGTNYKVTKIMLIQDGTNAYISEQNTILVGSEVATYDANISGGNINLLATPTSSSSTTFRVVATAINI